MDNLINVIDEREVLGKEFRVYGTIDEPLFLAKDVAEWIDYSIANVNKMLEKVDEEEKTTHTISMNGSNYQTQAWFLTEDGLYEVLMQSRKPIAKEFKKKVKEILKDIRKHGMYMTDNTLENMLNNPDYMIGLLTRYKEEKQARLKAEKELEIVQPKVEYHDNVLNKNGLLTTTVIAKDLGMSGQRLNKILHDNRVIFKNSGVWCVYSKYHWLIREGYADYKSYDVEGAKPQLKWTEKGRKWIIELVDRLRVNEYKLRVGNV